MIWYLQTSRAYFGDVAPDGGKEGGDGNDGCLVVGASSGWIDIFGSIGGGVTTDSGCGSVGGGIAMPGSMLGRC